MKRISIKRITNNILRIGLLTFLPLNALAQQAVEGTSYYLPRTAIKYTLLIERVSTQPGELCMYADRFLKKSDVATKPVTSYRILTIKISTEGVADTTKLFTPAIDAKHSISSIKVDDESGILLAVNADPIRIEKPLPFVAAEKPLPLNPRDYMSQEILAAGSSAKMAELIAQEIYDIRESKSQLNKGQADFMPKDGEQMRIMLNNLNTQEAALLQMFEGVTDRDTTETVITFIPDKSVSKQVLFRFSKYFGLVEADDLSGEPYYISIDDLHKQAQNTAIAETGKKGKDDAGIYANLPGKIRATLYHNEKMMMESELYAAQFGVTAPLDNELFGKKLQTSLIYHPATGHVETIQTEILKK